MLAEARSSGEPFPLTRSTAILAMTTRPPSCSRRVHLLSLALALPTTAVAWSAAAHPTSTYRVRASQPCAARAALSADVRFTYEHLEERLAAVRALKPQEQSEAVQFSLWKAAGLDPTFKVSGVRSGEPSFTRLFDHSV